MTDLNKDPDGPYTLMVLQMHLETVSVRYSYLRAVRAYLHEEFRDSIPVSSQGISVDDKFRIRHLYLARAYL